MEKIKNFLLRNTETKQTFIKNVFWLFVSEFGIRILKLIIFIYAAKKLGASEWGVFSYALALMSTFAIISDIGINAVLIKKIANKNLSTEYISTGFYLKLILSFVASLGLISTFFFIKENNVLRTIIPIMSLILFLDSFREFGFTLNRAFEKMEIEAITKIFTTITLVIFSFIFIYYNKTAISLAYSYLISGFIGVLLMYLIFKNYFKNIKQNFNKKLLIPIFKEAWPLAIVGVFGIIMTNIDTIILGWYKNVTDVGIYSVAQKPIQLIYVIPILISTAILPVLSKFSNINKEKMNVVINKALNISLLFAIPVVTGSILLGGQIMLSMFGQQYIESINIFKIIIFVILLSAPGVILSNVLFIEGKQKQIAKAILVGTIINFILCILLIPRYGIYGAALATTICQLISNTIIVVSAIRIPNIKLKLDIKKIIIATILMAIIIFFIKDYILIIYTISISLISYFIFLGILKENNIKEIYLLFKN